MTEIKGPVAVTGANGFIGNALCTALRKEGLYVRALIRSNANGPWHESHPYELANPEPPLSALQGIGTVFHLAGKTHALSEVDADEREYLNLNSEATRRLLKACAENEVTRFVYFSSVKAMGEFTTDSPEDEDTPPHPLTAYGKSKLQAEHHVLNCDYVPRVCVLRPATVYGPNPRGNIARMVSAINRHRFPPLPETGNQRSMVHVEDLVRAALLAAASPAASNRLYIVTDGCTYSTRELYEQTLSALGRKPPSWHIPIWLLGIFAYLGDLIGRLRQRRFAFDRDALEKLLSSAWYSSARIQRELGYAPQYNFARTVPTILEKLK